MDQLVSTIGVPGKRPLRKIYGAAFFILIFVLAVSLLVRAQFGIPQSFPVGGIFEVKEGDTLGSIAEKLEEQHIIKSPFWFQIATTISVGERSIKAGAYQFQEKLSLMEVIRKLSRGDYGFPVVKITIPEGLSNKEIADLLGTKLEHFATTTFLALASEKEGYLFPETYQFPVNISPNAVIEKMFTTFIEKLKPYEEEIINSGHTLAEVLTMAAILEEEGKTTESRKIVSGILWKRLELGIPLQVDATFLYINGKNTYELTTADLKIKSPYNTYQVKGLPPTPISNPGLDSIIAALRPIKTKYLYYLSERDGTMHYAATYDQHLRNKALYIKK